MHGVLWEDIYAAYNIIYIENKNSSLKEGNGIGLIGASYPDDYKEDKIYDSLVRSFNLTPNETAYYELLSKYSKFRHKYEKQYDSLSSLEKRLTSIERSLKTTDDWTKRDNLIKQYNTHLINYRALYDFIVARERPYFEAMDDLKKKDLTATVHVREYLSYCNKAIVHPVIANLELGRCLLRADILPRTGNQLIERIKSKGATAQQAELCEKWLKGSDSIGWKFSDDVLFISAMGDDLTITRKNPASGSASQKTFLNFNAIKRGQAGESVSEERPIFNQVAPLVCNTFYDYYRLNNFTKVMTAIRWAKQSGAMFLNKPKTPPLYKSPLYSKLTKDGQVILIDRE